MLANFLAKSKPVNFIVLLALFFSLFTVIYITFLHDGELNFFTILKFIVYILLFLIVFFFFNFIVSKNDLTFDNTYAFFIFTILCCYFLPEILEVKTLITFVVYLLFLRKIYSLWSSKKILRKLFDSGFWLAILFIIEHHMVVFGFLIYAGILLHKKIIINNFFAPIVGFITPMIIYFTYCFWFDKTPLFTNLFYFDDFSTLRPFLENNFNWVVFILSSLSFISILLKSPKVLSVNTVFKKNWLLILLHFMVVLFFIFLLPLKNGKELMYLIFSVSIIIANGFESIQNNILKNILFYIFLASMLMVPFVL